MNIKKVKTAYTHNGRMHADDVFSAALLKILNPKINIVRIDRKDLNKYKNKFLFDIGNGKFDHHSTNKVTRKNGIPYASFGLIMHEYYPLLGLNEEFYEKLDKDFIKVIDKVDNKGQGDSVTSPVSLIISLMNEKNLYCKQQEKTFVKAVNLARKILKTLIKHYLENQKNIIDVEKIIKDNPAKKYLVLDKFLPQHLFKDSSVQFIIFKNKQKHYEILSTNSFQYKINDTVTKDKIFVHPSRFLGIYKNLDTVKKVAQLSIV